MRLRQEDLNCKANISYMVRPCLNLYIEKENFSCMNHPISHSLVMRLTLVLPPCDQLQEEHLTELIWNSGSCYNPSTQEMKQGQGNLKLSGSQLSNIATL